MHTLDANNAVPLYEQLKAALREMIDTQLMRSGERLPSEAELCQRYGVSRITVRRAVDEMVEAGLLERRRGKGTFVVPNARKRVLMPVDDVIGGFSDGNIGKNIKTIIISKKEYIVNRFECEVLGLNESEHVLVLTRLMTVDGMPWMIDRATYPASRYPGFFEQVDDDKSTYGILRKQYGIVMTRAHKEFSLAYANQEQGELLECPAGTPMFKMFKVVYDKNDRAVHMSSTYFLGENVVFTIDGKVDSNEH